VKINEKNIVLSSRLYIVLAPPPPSKKSKAQKERRKRGMEEGKEKG